MTQPEASQVRLGVLSKVAPEVLVKEVQLKIALVRVPVSVFGLDAGLGGQLHLEEGIGDRILLAGIRPPAVRGELGIADAEGKVLVDAGDDALSGPRPIFTAQSGRLKGDTVPVEERVEFVEGERSRPSGADEGQVALGQPWLDGRHVQRLKQLRLQQLAHAGDLVAGLPGIGIGQQAMGREVRLVGVD